MASPALFRSIPQQELYVCARCASKARSLSPKVMRRYIGIKYLTKVKKAEEQWQQKAQEIKGGKQKSMLSILEERGLVHQIAGDRDALDTLMTEKRIGAYVGIDPTASSLHVGHLLPLMSIFWMYVHGFHAVSLLGGATAKVGDPTGRLVSREREHSSIRTANMVNMHYQLKKLWTNVEQYGRRYGYEWEWAWHRELVNNNAWMNKLPIMEVLQVLGPGMRLGTMLGRDTVKNKMEKGDGMSFSEFTYPLLQAWDWWHMYNTKGIQMQIGGADQFGNIIAGMDAIKYITTHHPDPDMRKGRDAPSEAPFGFTVPLLTTSAGEKFGKSAGNAIWLDKEQTSTFDLYGFFIRQPDADVGRYLRLFTFMPMEAIDALVTEHEKEPSKRVAQHRLAREFVELIHGPDEAKEAEAKHRLLFAKPSTLSGLIAPATGSATSPTQITLNNAPQANIKLPSSLIYTKSIGKILYAAGLANSISEGHRLAADQAVYVGGMSSGKGSMDEGSLSFTPVKTWVIEETSKFIVAGKLLILRRGKHNVRIVEVVSDEKWAASGQRYPGERQDPPPPKNAIDVEAEKEKIKGMESEFTPSINETSS